jgi:plastocyanin
LDRKGPKGTAAAIVRAVLAPAALLLAAVPACAQVSGSVALESRGKPLRAEAASEVVLYFRPERPVPVQPLADVEMRTQRKQFLPGALPVTVGTTVTFPNVDPILHNVFSPGPRAAFDLGLFGRGEARTHTFDAPGLVRVYCNVHHDMVGHVLVLDTPWFGRPDAQGRFRLEVPAGVRGELFAWHERAPLWRSRLESGVAAGVEVRMQLDRPKVPRHMNKFGKPYGSGRDRGY